MAEFDVNPFALEEPEWLKDTQRRVNFRPVGGAELPEVEKAYDALRSAAEGIKGALIDAIRAGGVSVESTARLLAALQSVEQVDSGIETVRAALWYHPLTIRVIFQEEDNPF